MLTTAAIPGALPPQEPLDRKFDDRVRDGVASLLLAGLAGFVAFRFFAVKRKGTKSAGLAARLASRSVSDVGQ